MATIKWFCRRRDKTRKKKKTRKYWKEMVMEMEWRCIMSQLDWFFFFLFAVVSSLSVGRRTREKRNFIVERHFSLCAHFTRTRHVIGLMRQWVVMKCMALKQMIDQQNETKWKRIEGNCMWPLHLHSAHTYTRCFVLHVQFTFTLIVFIPYPHRTHDIRHIHNTYMYNPGKSFSYSLKHGSHFTYTYRIILYKNIL